MELDQAQEVFLIECRELLQQMEDSLIKLEKSTEDDETLNVLFGAAHTIKGSAGLFDFNAIVDFTHVVETVLDEVRNKEVVMTPEVISLLLICHDHIDVLVEQTIVAGAEIDEDTQLQGAELLRRLQAISASVVPIANAASQTPQQATEQTTIAASPTTGGSLAVTDYWHISVRFCANVLRDGMDPLSFLRFLATLGDLVNIITITDQIPKADEMDPESCYLGYEIAFRSDADKATIEDVFEFVRDDSWITIIPPRSRISDYIDRIHELEDDQRLGELLVNIGSLTQNELDKGLKQQSLAAEDAAENAQAAPQLGEVLVEQGVVEQRVVNAALEKQVNLKANAQSHESKTIRVDADKLSSLINLVGELVIASANADLLARRTGEDDIIESMEGLSMLVEEIRDTTLDLRMVQIGDTFNRFHRVVRDLSKKMNKEIELEISGGETELDKTVVEKISDPLTHLVRNSIDHGIESVSVRKQRGKPAKGTIKLNAYHDSGSIVIEIIDDGGGLDSERILAKARERGIIATDQTLTNKEIYQLIFAAGFSTAEVVTDLSGRGVGMDVVRRNIESLRGHVSVDSTAGIGTTITIRLPLTLAIIDGFLVNVGNAAYVIPLDMVVECIEFDDAERAANQSREYINLRGEVLPFLHLRKTFAEEADTAKRENMVVVKYAGQSAGLIVDELRGELQTVIKPLGKLFEGIRGISGATILGSGNVAVILDIPTLISQAAKHQLTSIH